jgi:hypothetical protein
MRTHRVIMLWTIIRYRQSNQQGNTIQNYPDNAHASQPTLSEKDEIAPHAFSSLSMHPVHSTTISPGAPRPSMGKI